MLSATREQRATVSAKLRELLDDLSSEAADIGDEAVGCQDETLTTDRHQLEIVLLSQADEFLKLLSAYRIERDRLQSNHDLMLTEIDMHDRSERVGYGHLQVEMV